MAEAEKPTHESTAVPQTPAGAPPVPALEDERPRRAPAAEAPGPLEQFDALLAGARRRLRMAALVEATCAAAAGGALGLMVALVVVGVAPYSMALRGVLVALVPAGAVAAASLIAWRRVLPLRHALVVGARIEEALRRRGCDARDAVRGAVELRDSARAGGAELGRSRALCEAHITSTTRRVVDGSALESLPAVALERAVSTLAAGSAVALLVLVWVAAAGPSFHARWDKLFSAEGAERALEARQAQLLPLVTDLKLTLRFPAYMNEADQVITGASGDVVAPRGAEVTVEGRADRTLRAASLIVNDDEIAAEVLDGRMVRARFVVDKPGAYRFKLHATLGAEVDPVAHKIALRTDAPPVVTLEEPAADATVKLADDVRLAFSARDDVAVTRFRVVVKRQGSARQPFVKDLLEVPGGLPEARGSGVFRVEETGARPGEKLSVYVEAFDNDAVEGQKAGRSQTRVLTVFSPLEQHRLLLARLEDVLARMVESLGDELETPIAALANPSAADALEQHRRLVERHRGIGGRHAGLMGAVADALLVLADDEVAPAAVRRALANMKLLLGAAVEDKGAAIKTASEVLTRGTALNAGLRTRLLGHQRTLVERLEQNAIYLEDLLNRERLAEARQLAEELERAQADLKALMDQYKETGDPVVRQALLDEIRSMRQQMAQLMERLASLQREIPDEFLNQEAFEHDEMMERATEIDRLIEEGKLDEAAAALDEMLKSTQELMEGLDEAGEELGGDDYKELREKMDTFSDELRALTEAQDAMLDASEAAMDKARQAAEAQLKGKLDEGLAEVRKKVERAAEKLAALDDQLLFLNEAEDAQFARARVEDLRRALEAQDVDDASSSVEEAEAAARAVARSIHERTDGRFGQRDPATLEQRAAVDDAQRQLAGARDELKKLLPDPNTLLDKTEQQRMSRGADEQEQLGENAGRLEQLMEQIGKEAPIFGPEHRERMNEARQAMQRASREMRAQNLPGARAAQRQALHQLSELGRDLDEQGSKGGGGIPMPLPRGGSPGAERRDEGGDGRQAGREDVAIPDGSGFQVPDAYRKDILDAMREGAPESWASEVKRYYEKLIK